MLASLNWAIFILMSQDSTRPKLLGDTHDTHCMLRKVLKFVLRQICICKGISGIAIFLPICLNSSALYCACSIALALMLYFNSIDANPVFSIAFIATEMTDSLPYSNI